MVLADSAELAEDAVQAVALDIEPSAAGRRPARVREGRRAPVRGHGQQLRDACSRPRRATSTRRSAMRAYTRREQFRVQRMTAMPMETRGLLAEWDAAAAQLTVSGAAKLPFFNRRAMASMMGLPEEAVDYIEYRRRRRLRRARRVLSGGFSGRVRGAQVRPSGQMGRGPARAFHGHRAFARDRVRDRDRARPRRHDPRAARRHLVRHRRLCAAERHDAGAQCRAVHLRALSGPQSSISARMR